MPIEELREILQIDEGFALRSRENSRLEYKESFNLGNAARYARTMAAFANARGGFIVFGVTDTPRELVGLRNDRFERLDPARLTAFLNSNLSPEIMWEAGTADFNGRSVGFIEVFESREKPIIATANSGADLKEGEIYYRYRGQTRTVGYPELRQIIDDRLELERRAWRQHIERIAQAGPTQVAVLDAPRRQLVGAGPPYLIDPALVDTLTFIKEGEFREADGAPTLRLVGDVVPVEAVAPVAAVPLSIHFDDIISSFLADRSMPPPAGLAFLEEAFRQNSHYLPLHYLRRKAAELPLADALSVLEGTRVHPDLREKLRRRLQGEERVTPVGAVDNPLPEVESVEEMLRLVAAAPTQKSTRSILVRGLTQFPEVLPDVTERLEPARIFEAVTHVPPQTIRSNPEAIRQVLSRPFLAGYDQWTSPTRSLFRKAVAYLDDVLFEGEAPLARDE